MNSCGKDFFNGEATAVERVLETVEGEPENLCPGLSFFITACTFNWRPTKRQEMAARRGIEYTLGDRSL